MAKTCMQLLLCGSAALAAPVGKEVPPQVLIAPMNATAPGEQYDQKVKDQFGTGGYTEKCMKGGRPNVLWGNMDADGSGNDLFVQAKKVVHDAGLKSGSSVYESGCGCGGMLWAFTQTQPGLKVGGNDIFEGPLGTLKAYFKDDASNFKQESSEELKSVQSNSYDASYTMGAIPIMGTLPKICSGFQEMVRITKVGGMAFSLGHVFEGGPANYYASYGGIPTPTDFWSKCFQDNMDKSVTVSVQTMKEAGATTPWMDEKYGWGGFHYVTITKVAEPTFAAYNGGKK